MVFIQIGKNWISGILKALPTLYYFHSCKNEWLNFISSPFSVPFCTKFSLSLISGTNSFIALVIIELQCASAMEKYRICSAINISNLLDFPSYCI